MTSRAGELLGDGTDATQGASALFRALGGWGSVAGPSSFMIRAVVVGSSSAVIVGLTGGMAGSFFYGTASLPFLIMSSIGFVMGITRWYRTSVAHALLQLDRFPALLRLHLDANFPAEKFRSRPLEYFRGDEFKASWRMQSMLVTGWLTAQGAIDQVHAAEEQALVAEASQEIAISKGELQLLQ